MSLNTESISTYSLEEDKVIINTQELSKNTEVRVYTKPIYNAKPSFTMIGDGYMNNKHKDIAKSIDLLNEVANMTSAEKFCFFIIKNNIHYDNYTNTMIYQVKVAPYLFSNTDKALFLRGFTLLKNKNLVRRISKSVYMINPNALIPARYTKELAIWDKAKK